jgi:hypothetical protein
MARAGRKPRSSGKGGDPAKVGRSPAAAANGAPPALPQPPTPAGAAVPAPAPVGGGPPVVGHPIGAPPVRIAEGLGEFWEPTPQLHWARSADGAQLTLQQAYRCLYPPTKFGQLTWVPVPTLQQAPPAG